MGITVVGRKEEESEIGDERVTGDERWRLWRTRKRQGYGRRSEFSGSSSTATSTSTPPSRSRFFPPSSSHSFFLSYAHRRRLPPSQAIENCLSWSHPKRFSSQLFPSSRLSIPHPDSR